jgi:drug/metabolite transporter (DMT)-like permease
MKHYENNKKRNLYLLSTIILWSLTPAVAKLALSELSNYQLLFYTSIVGSISLFLVNYFQGKLNLLSQYKSKDYLIMLLMGFVGIFLYYVFLYGAFARAPAGQVNVINYLWPVFIIVFSIPILHEKFNWKTISAILLSFIGALIAFTQGSLSAFGREHITGYLLALLAAICYGIFSVVGKKLNYEKFSSMFVYYIIATFLIIPASLATSGFILPKSLTTIVAILSLGGIMNSIAFVFWFKALKIGDTHKTANLVYSVPFLAMIWTYLLNRENFSIASIFGLALIIVGIFIQLTNNVDQKNKIEKR